MSHKKMKIKDKRKFTRFIVVALCGAVLIIALAVAGSHLLRGDKDPAPNPDSQGKVTGQDGNTGENGLTAEELKAREEQRRAAEERGLLFLVNKENPVDEDYKPEDLTSILYYAEDRDPSCRYMRKEAAEHFHALVEAAKEEGHTLMMTTAYRSYGFQQILWNNYVSREGEEAASRYSARPGTSEHQSGLAVDVTSPDVDYQLSYEFDESPSGAWMAENAHKFGFIIRFPEGKEDITGYLYEPWHLRYVGEDVAKVIYDEGITLEEYLEE